MLRHEASWFVSLNTNATTSSKLSKNVAARKRSLYKKVQYDNWIFQDASYRHDKSKLLRYYFYFSTRCWCFHQQPFRSGNIERGTSCKLAPAGGMRTEKEGVGCSFEGSP